MPPRLAYCIIASLAIPAPRAGALPSLEATPVELRVTATGYRATFQRGSADFSIELKGADGRWFMAAKSLDRPEFGLSSAGESLTSSSSRAEIRHATSASFATVGSSILVGSDPPAAMGIHFLCADRGILIRFQLSMQGGGRGTCWALPRIPLDRATWDRYAFWDKDDHFRAGRIGDLGESDRYAGVSPWGHEGDTSERLSARHPAIIAVSETRGIGLAAVFPHYREEWGAGHSFIQRHRPHSLFFYPAVAPSDAAQSPLWAWLAPVAPEQAAATDRVESLLATAETLISEFRPVAPTIDPALLLPVADFPPGLRRDKPLADIRDAIVYTVNEYIDSERGIAAARKAGSDVLIRGWFKWRDAQDWARLAHLVPKAHAMGALFGGGVTCSALYHGENGLPEDRVLDMATRGPDGHLVDAWGEAGTRHGTLSNPAYLDYVLSFCKRQIDAGADYLFMDEINAALHANEGFDDHSIRDFRQHLVRGYCEGKGWGRGDALWREALGVDTANHNLCPDGTIASLDYRAFLKLRGLTDKPHAHTNPLAGDWAAFREARDDRAWRYMTDQIRAHAAAKGRRVLISGNGLARYVDLQVLGVWGLWKAADGKIDLSEDLVDRWSGTVAAGRALAGERVPVVFFHDWGFGGFPWIRDVPPPERELWMRTRGAEIYASGAFFAFPVAGPWGNDALADGTIREIARQARFYRSHRDLYLGPTFAGFDGLLPEAPDLSVALWKRQDPPALILHAINRQARDSRPAPRSNIAILVPTARAPSNISIVSPDWESPRQGAARIEGDRLRVTIPELEAYAVAILEYPEPPPLSMGGPRIRPMPDWGWAGGAHIAIGPDGMPAPRSDFPGAFLHGNLHGHLRHPHVFAVNMPGGGRLRVSVRAVATLGARIECQTDDRPPRAVDLPDLDQKNDAAAAEYDRVLEFSIPPGTRRVTVKNTGGDWAHLDWYAFDGEIVP
ncbi:MAG: hypothetical protein IT577_18105 [Verrucomicrobiae bacterium]|nr:hypothetical protein [Verrucomicrobiae bacterium]